MTITRAPVLLGDGISLFGKTKSPIKLEDTQAKAYPNDFIQIKYKVNYLYLNSNSALHHLRPN